MKCAPLPKYLQRHIVSKVAASTLIEVMIAMVIIIIVFAIAMQIFLNIEGLNGNREKIKAMILVNSYYQRALNSQEIIEFTVENGHLEISQEVLELNAIQRTIIIEIIARNKNNDFIIYKKRELIELKD